ncbi:MAG: hypothetical protein AVDCRST_MAG88-344, partial [uncultured Thermomicrobiales bacterium]
CDLRAGTRVGRSARSKGRIATRPGQIAPAALVCGGTPPGATDDG